MSDSQIQAHPAAVRKGATTLTTTGYHLGHGLHAAPGLTVTAPQWRAATALAALESAVHSYLGTIGGQAAQVATGLRTAADEYDAADERAAHRLARAD